VEAVKTDFTEADLTLPRRKPRSLAISVAYRLVRAARALFGAKRVLRFFLDAAWLSWRFAFEVSSDVFGEEFQSDARGISHELLRAHIPAGGTVLDAGCGPGRWTRIVARYAGHVVGVDASADDIARARRETAASNVEYIAGDVRDIIAARRFDAALLVHVLEHIDDPDAFLRAMSAAAKVLIIEVPNFEADPLNAARHVLGRRWYTDADHVREYTPAILRDQLLRSGLEIVREEQNRGSIVAVARRA
jgi:SAM-dependent methyltransferase